MQAVRFVLLLSRQGKVRLAKWYTTYTQKERAKVQWQCASPAGTSAGSRVGASLSLLQVVRDVTPMVLARALKLCNFLDYRDSKVQQLLPSRSCAGLTLLLTVSCRSSFQRRRTAETVLLQVVYKRYASLYFVMGVDSADNELLTLEIIHHFVEVLDRYFGNVCELDLIFNFHKVRPNAVLLPQGCERVVVKCCQVCSKG